jgi:hypothetical protein
MALKPFVEKQRVWGIEIDVKIKTYNYQRI